MKKIFIASSFILFAALVNAQNVGIGTLTPVAKLNIVGNYSIPTIPGVTSTGVFRIGVSAGEGIDFGKKSTTPFSAWMQIGYLGSAEPLSIQPMGGNVGIGIIDPAPSAKLEISSTTQGFLPPRLSYTQRDAIATPAEGLMIYNTETKKPNYFDGTGWKNFDGTSAAFTIGTPYQGGKVAYILQSGDPGYIAGQYHGLIAAATDQSTGSGWGCSGTALPGADGTALGTGNQNTIDIMAGCATVGIAARLCGDLVLNGYSDWYLPSKDELNKLHINRVAIGGFSSNDYWSSSEFSSFNAWYQDFINGNNFATPKSTPFYVRAVRAF